MQVIDIQKLPKHCQRCPVVSLVNAGLRIEQKIKVEHELQYWEGIKYKKNLLSERYMVMN